MSAAEPSTQREKQSTIDFLLNQKSKDDLELVLQDLEEANLSVADLKQIKQQVHEDCQALQARIKKWEQLERKLQKRVSNARKQVQNVKKLVSENQ